MGEFTSHDLKRTDTAMGPAAKQAVMNCKHCKQPLLLPQCRAVGMCHGCAYEHHMAATALWLSCNVEEYSPQWLLIRHMLNLMHREVQSAVDAHSTHAQPHARRDDAK